VQRRAKLKKLKARGKETPNLFGGRSERWAHSLSRQRHVRQRSDLTLAHNKEIPHQETTWAHDTTKSFSVLGSAGGIERAEECVLNNKIKSAWGLGEKIATRHGYPSTNRRTKRLYALRKLCYRTLGPVERCDLGAPLGQGDGILAPATSGREGARAAHTKSKSLSRVEGLKQYRRRPTKLPRGV
jgi:hypothetical protein